MDSVRSSGRRAAALLTILLMGGLLFGGAVPASAIVNITDRPQTGTDFDARVGSLAPSATQRAIVARLGAHVSWSRFGTPQSLIRYGRFLATGLRGTPVEAARSWVRANRALFKLSEAGVDRLQVIGDARMYGTPGHAVIFRQQFGGLPAAQDGMITVGITSGNVAYVSSSSAGDQALTGNVALTPVQAWLKAAAGIGWRISPASISNLHREDGWTVFHVHGFPQPQRSRLRALPTISRGARPAYETLVTNVRAPVVIAKTAFVDAEDGSILYLHDNVQNFALPTNSTDTFSGQYTPPKCGKFHGPYKSDSKTKTITVVAAGGTPATDLVIELHKPKGNVVASQDLLFSPEVLTYNVPKVGGAGDYYVRICPYPGDPGPPPYDYAGTITMSESQASSTPYPYPPAWRFFKAVPPLSFKSNDTRAHACWERLPATKSCKLVLKNLAARGPWDYDYGNEQPTFTTIGNAANTAEAWGSPLTPFEQYRPTDPHRKYVFPWTNQWNKTKCDPAAFFTPQRNDIAASVANLFAVHNRMHDWSYFLGFRERNFNMQQHNFGLTHPGAYPAGREDDPETGDAQAGALSGGQPSFLGRDNANQITVNDGIPGITNQYLFQPIADAFYAPCTDGDYDMEVVGHEYTHAISNRMVGGPDAGLSGYQAGSMGESWSDLDALEYLHEYHYVPVDGENPWAEGPYVTLNNRRGIRNYALNHDPLNFSDLGYDKTGPEVHADGEIWNGTNYTVRQALVRKYDKRYPERNRALQRQCANGFLPANRCPGNRRWAQIMYDAWLLMPPGVSMLDARDAYLAADKMRFRGADQRALWRAFARRGMGCSTRTNKGRCSHSNGTGDDKGIPDFESPYGPNAHVRFEVRNAKGEHLLATIFVGRYQARAVPDADTFPKSEVGVTANFVPGHYQLLARSAGYGMMRFAVKLRRGRSTVIVRMPTNWASRANGAKASGDGVDRGHLIDDTEATNWAVLGRDPSADGSQVTVALGKGRHRITRIEVSAMLRPPNDKFKKDPDTQDRFSALRQFTIEACTAAGSVKCTKDSEFHAVFKSGKRAFPSTYPRPLAPDMLIRGYKLPHPVSATHLRLVVVHNQCTGAPQYQGDQDNDPTNSTDCDADSDGGKTVRAAELEAFGRKGTVRVVRHKG